MQTDTLNIDALKKLVDAHPKYREVLGVLGNCNRGRNRTTFRRVRRLLFKGGMKDWTPDMVKDFFMHMQSVGAGTVVYSEKEPPRFVWSWHLVSLCRAALGLPDKPRLAKDGTAITSAEGEVRKQTPPRKLLPRVGQDAAPSAKVPVSPEPPKLEAPVRPLGNIIEMRRPGLEVKVDLSKMTPEECKRITALLLGQTG